MQEQHPDRVVIGSEALHLFLLSFCLNFLPLKNRLPLMRQAVMVYMFIYARLYFYMPRTHYSRLIFAHKPTSQVCALDFDTLIHDFRAVV